MRRPTSLWTRLAVAALVSGLAAILMVTVGPGFAEKPDDLGPSENAAAEAQDNAAESAASEEGADESASEDVADEAAAAASTDEAATESAVAAADKGKPDGPPGQSSAEGADTELAASGAGSSSNSDSAPGHTKINEDTSQTGLPRGQEEDECTNTHHGDDNDFSGHGANKHGLYDNTCDGRASENGSGGGNATGRPCMGCVGNADDKNPKGQSPNRLGGRDHNAGYECDRNKGVGQGNPAHTDCRPTDILTICHSDDEGDTWRVITDTRDDIEEILEEDGPTYAFVVDEDTDPDDCEDDEPPCVDKPQTPKDECGEDEEDPDCLGHVPPHPQHTPGSPACPEEEKFVSICHRARNSNGPGVIIRRISIQGANNGHLNHPAHDDFLIEDDDDIARCIPTDEELFSVCHVDDDDFDIIGGLTEEELEEHLDEHDDDFEVEDGDDVDRCDEDEDEDCLGHSPPHDNHERGDAACEDIEDRLSICHVEGNTGTIKRNLDEDDARDELDRHPADFIVDDDDAEEECGEEPVVVTVCPASSDRPMRVIPKGRTAEWCYIDDEVQGEVIRNIPAPGMPKPNVQGKLVPRPETRGGVLPFTGASLLAFVVLALQLIAAGSLIMRGRKA